MITKNLSSFWQKTYDDDKKPLMVLNLKTIKGFAAGAANPFLYQLFFHIVMVLCNHGKQKSKQQRK